MASRREQMSPADRAKQFMPFDALKGFREALKQKEKILVPKRELSEEQKEALSRILLQIKKNDMVSVEYFYQGEYRLVNGMVSSINTTARFLTVVNTKIKFEDIADIQKTE